MDLTMLGHMILIMITSCVVLALSDLLIFVFKEFKKPMKLFSYIRETNQYGAAIETKELGTPPGHIGYGTPCPISISDKRH